MIEAGQQFGLYVVKEVFTNDEKRGSCCAEDPFFNREVLLQVFSTEDYSETQLGRLERLFERLAALDHPSLAPIYDSGQEEHAFYYTSACYLEPSLAARLGTPLDEEPALKLAYELAEALAYAYDLGLGQRQLTPEKICFDEDGRAVLVDFAIDAALRRLASGDEFEQLASDLEACLRSLGELLLQTLLGPDYDREEPIEILCAKIIDSGIRQLVGRFLLPGECRFASFTELLEELRSFDAIKALEKDRSESTRPAFDSFSVDEVESEAPDESLVAELRQLVAEKNDLQQALDNALTERNRVDNQLAEGKRQLDRLKQEVAKAKEEANVAWELVAGQKYDRWRPAIWAAGGFLVGFILSGSYGYYYSEQTRNELLAKLQANEELIKTATWRPAEEQQQQAGDRVATVADEPARQKTAAATDTTGEPASLASQALAEIPAPVAEVAKQWWPAGSEFSAAAAVPIEQLKAALGFTEGGGTSDLPEFLRQEVLATVRRWADAWAGQDLAGYFSMYSENYRPELGRSQEEWRDMRRSRVTRPQWIHLDIEDIRLRQLSEDRIQVKLKQSYQSDFYQDRIIKSINLIREDGQWRILMERSLGMLEPNEEIVGG